MEADNPTTETTLSMDEVWKQVDERKAIIEKNSNGRKVFPIVIPCGAEIKPEGVLIGFAYEPDLVGQLRLMDRGQEFSNGFSMEACHQVLESLIIPGETDEAILDKSGRAVYWKGACLALNQFALLATPVIKKN